MGLFGAARAFAHKVKEAAHNVKEKGKEICRSIKEKVTNMAAKFTGKDKFDEADRLYEQITERYNSKRKQFDTDSEKYINSIERHVDEINRSKKRIKTELFPRMAKKMERIKDYSITQQFPLEDYQGEEYEFDSVRSREQLYTIDFNKHKFKTTIQAIFTLGFYTRKKAQETLYAVQEEEKKITAEIAKMNAELAKLKAIDTALSNVELYFTELIEIYERLLVRLDNNVNYLYVRCIAFAHKIVREEMSIRHLPKAQVEEVKAITSASMILKKMVETKIVSVEEKNTAQCYDNDMKDQYDKICTEFKAA